MTDDLRHNMNLVIPGLNFLGDQNNAAKSIVDKTKWVMETAIDRIEKLESALRKIIQEDAITGKTVFVGDFGKIARQALEGKDDPQTNF